MPKFPNIPSRYLIPLLIVIGIAAYFLVDSFMEDIWNWVMSLIGIGGANEAAKEANKAITRSEVHDDNSDQRFDEGQKHHKEAVSSHDEALQAAEDVTAPKESDGFKRRKSSSH